MGDYNVSEELRKHQEIYGERYQLPNGSQVNLHPEEVGEFLKSHFLVVHCPSSQGSSVEEEQAGIKSA